MNEVLIVLMTLAGFFMLWGMMDAMLSDDDGMVFGALMLWLEMNIIGKIILFIPFGFLCLFGFIGYFFMVGFKFLIFMRF